MTCRAPTAAATCTGSTPTGAVLSYDNEGQLTGWTSALNGAPTPNTAAFAYDGEGSRVAMQSTNGALGVTTTTDYLLGGLEEVAGGGSSGSSSTLTEYYPLPGIGTAVRVSTSSSSTLSYLASDGLGSVSVALSTTGAVTAQALYAPYGTVRYSSGQMPTAHGYTGQTADTMTGLSYYGARYYDPALGQFTSADSVLDGLNRYAYVGGNPESATDPSGHDYLDELHKWVFGKGILWAEVPCGAGGEVRCDHGTRREQGSHMNAPARKSYPTDLSDNEWTILEPLVPAAKAGGRPARWERREIANAIFYVVRSGCTWRQLPHDFPPWQTVYDYFRSWRHNGTLEALHARLRERLRRALGRATTPRAAIIDSQSVKTTERGGHRESHRPSATMAAKR